jgi:DNA-binding NtrC family response regulator
MEGLSHGRVQQRRGAVLVILITPAPDAPQLRLGLESFNDLGTGGRGASFATRLPAARRRDNRRQNAGCSGSGSPLGKPGEPSSRFDMMNGIPPVPLGPPSRSVAYIKALEDLRRWASYDDVPILLEGESGTGKTQLARQLHLWSPRARDSFCEVLIPAIADGLLTSELFGHAAGAFTGARERRDGLFQSANGGTAFLDELGKASLAVQGALLHVIEYGKLRPCGSDREVVVDVRIVAATNVPLRRLVEQGTVLPDIEARLGTFSCELPPLRRRPEDIPGLVHHLIAIQAAKCRYAHPPEVHPELMELFRLHEWPGNLRELSDTLRRLMVDAKGEKTLTPNLCFGRLAEVASKRKPPRGELTPTEITQALAQCNGNMTHAARLLGRDRSTLYRHLQDQMPNGTFSVSVAPERCNTFSGVAPQSPTRSLESRTSR